MTGLGAAGRVFDAALATTGQRVVDAAPTLEPLALRARDRYARSYVGATTLANYMRYDAPPDPYRLVSVDPADVEYVVGDARPMYRRAGVVKTGDWDLVDQRFEDMDVYRAYEAHFERGVPWSETAFYDRVVEQIDAGWQRWGCTSRAEFDERCERLDDLYDTIATQGYRSQAELAADRGTDPLERECRLPTEQYKNEVAVHVGRNGEFLFADGRNRLSIAKLLGLDSIPVRVLYRHSRWQRVRDAYARDEHATTEGTHPDLEDVARKSPVTESTA